MVISTKPLRGGYSEVEIDILQMLEKGGYLTSINPSLYSMSIAADKIGTKEHNPLLFSASDFEVFKSRIITLGIVLTRSKLPKI